MVPESPFCLECRRSHDATDTSEAQAGNAQIADSDRRSMRDAQASDELRDT